jgi:hypothetical protein
MADFETMPIGTRKLLEDCAAQFQCEADIQASREDVMGRLNADMYRKRWVKRIRELLDQ